MTLTEHTIRSIYESHQTEFSPEYIESVNVIELRDNIYLGFQDGVPPKPMVDGILGFRYPEYIVDKSDGSFHSCSVGNLNFEEQVYSKWKSKGRSGKYYDFARKEIAALSEEQKAYESFVKKTQKIQQGFWKNKLILGNEEEISFSTRGIKMIGELSFILPNTFLVETLIVLFYDSGKMAFVSIHVEGFSELFQFLQKKKKDFYMLFSGQYIQNNSAICWPITHEMEDITTPSFARLFYDFDIYPKTNKESEFVEKYSRYPLRGELTALK